MKPISITIQHTRQVRQYEPVVVSISADLKNGEDVEQASIELQTLVLRIIYKDQPKERDMLIEKLCNSADNRIVVKNDEIQDFISSGDLLFNQKAYKSAIVQYNKALNLDSSDKNIRDKIKKSQVKMESSEEGLTTDFPALD